MWEEGSCGRRGVEISGSKAPLCAPTCVSVHVEMCRPARCFDCCRVCRGFCTLCAHSTRYTVGLGCPRTQV